MGTLHRRAVYGALVTFLACHSAAVDAVTLATAQSSSSASVLLTGLPDTAVCMSGTRGPSAEGVASGDTFAIATTNTPSDMVDCASSSPGSYRMTYSGLLQSAESGLLIDSRGGDGIASYGLVQEMFLRGGAEVGFFVPGPLTLSWSFDLSFALAVSTADLPTPDDTSFAFAAALIQLELCRWDPRLSCTQDITLLQSVNCGPTAPGTPCVAAVSGTESQVLDVVIPESGFWTVRVRSISGGQTQVFQTKIPEPSSFALLLLGLFGMAAGRCARRRLA